MKMPVIITANIYFKQCCLFYGDDYDVSLKTNKPWAHDNITIYQLATWRTSLTKTTHPSSTRFFEAIYL